jgi:bacteriorhodopsin
MSSSSYQAAGWTPFAVFGAAVVGAFALRYNAESQTTRLRLLLLLCVYGVSLPVFGIQALEGGAGTNVVAGQTVNWARYAVNAIRVPLFAALIALSLDPVLGKAFAAAAIGVGMSLPLVFGTESSNDGNWFFFIFSGASAIIYAIYAIWFLQTPPDRLQFVSNLTSWFVKLASILGFWTYVFCGYVIDTNWTNATGDPTMLQWLFGGWDIIVYAFFGLYVLGFVDIFEDSKTLVGMHIPVHGLTGGAGNALPYMAPSGAPLGYTSIPSSSHYAPGVTHAGLSMPK